MRANIGSTSNSTSEGYLLPEGKRVLDFAGCRDGEATLAIVGAAGDETLDLVEWPQDGDALSIYRLPAPLTRVFLCWASAER